MDAGYRSITSDAELRAFCRQLADARWVALDTEFVSEDTFRPQLCLVQVCAGDELTVIDPLTAGEMQPFWEALAQEGRETIVHSGRGEVEFCMQAVGRPPAELFDVQLAAGLVGLEYPAGYGNLIARLLGQRPKKHETRTDWRRRPLSSRQIQYALDDVRYLHPIRDRLRARLEELGRLDWLAEELAAWLREIALSLSEERWWRVSGNAGLSGKGLAIVRELWRWRQAEAQHRDKPARRILRDDLIIELARRETADLKRVRAVRGMEWGRLQQQLPEIVECIERALASPEQERPQTPQREMPGQLAVLAQLLSSALGSICRQAQLAPSLVGTPSDVRELILHLTGLGGSGQPFLAQGWRAGVVGHLFEDILAGKLAIRVADPHAEHPLVIEPVAGAPPENAG